MVEKPPRDEAPSDLAIIGRYILTPDIFPALEATVSDRTGEIQLTNGLRQLLKDRPIYGCRVDGVRHDTGNKLGFLKAVVYFALRRPDLAGPFSDYSADRRAEGAYSRLRSRRRRRRRRRLADGVLDDGSDDLARSVALVELSRLLVARAPTSSTSCQPMLGAAASSSA